MFVHTSTEQKAAGWPLVEVFSPVPPAGGSTVDRPAVLGAEGWAGLVAVRPSGLCLLDMAVTGRCGRGSSLSGRKESLSQRGIKNGRIINIFCLKCTFLLTTFSRELYWFCCRFPSSSGSWRRFLRRSWSLRTCFCHGSERMMGLGCNKWFFLSFEFKRRQEQMSKTNPFNKMEILFVTDYHPANSHVLMINE